MQHAHRLANSSRRGFLGAAGAAATALGWTLWVPRSAHPSALAPSQRPRIGFIGTGSRCHAHMDICNKFKAEGKVETVAVCDVYGPRAEAAAKKTGGKVYRNYRDLLADSGVDVVCIASPDRHHAPQAIEAVRAGKDVFVEKPLTHWLQFDLARQLAEESGQHGRIVQVGTQYMADEAYAQAHDLIRQGVIGKIVHIQAGYFRRGDWGERMPIPDPNAKPGPDLDWDLFLGDAPKVPFSVSRFFQWRMYWDYSGGPATDLLVHTYTPIFRLLDVDYPERVVGMGGKWHYDGLREVPDTFNMTIDYSGGPSVVLMNSLSNETGIGTVVRGTDGTLTFEGRGIVITPHGAKEPSHVIAWKGMGNTELLWANFLECVQTRQRPWSPVDVGAKVQAPLNMAILSYRENKVARFDREKMQIVL